MTVKQFKLLSGRIANAYPYSFTSAASKWIARLTPTEAHKMKLEGYSTGRYAYLILQNGEIYRENAGGYLCYVKKVQAPEVIDKRQTDEQDTDH